MEELEKNAESLERPLPATLCTAWIIDGMAMTQMISVTGMRTFGDLAEKLFTMVFEPFDDNQCK